MEQKASVYERNTELLLRLQNGDEEAESLLIEENVGLVHTVARRFSERGTEYEDLVQIGTIGMLKAIRSFSLERGTAFSTYAVPLIVGEIRKHLRDDGPVKVSRIYRRQGLSILHEKNRILTEEGREAGIAELASRCGVSKEDAAISLDAISPITSLSDFVYGEESVTYEGVLSDEESERESERICDRVALAQSIGRLPPLWRKIVLLRYYRSLTQQQTANMLGLTQVKVSREEKKLLEFLKKELS
ncbi:MAG: sigma-70 family RNA polymerase sigma factor [Clostridia bacterium]|nr:sigma-70 family RNA polymerase sigma factor [Clostridia bacterium]